MSARREVLGLASAMTDPWIRFRADQHLLADRLAAQEPSDYAGIQARKVAKEIAASPIPESVVDLHAEWLEAHGRDRVAGP